MGCTDRDPPAGVHLAESATQTWQWCSSPTKFVESIYSLQTCECGTFLRRIQFKGDSCATDQQCTVTDCGNGNGGMCLVRDGRSPVVRAAHRRSAPQSTGGTVHGRCRNSDSRAAFSTERAGAWRVCGFGSRGRGRVRWINSGTYYWNGSIVHGRLAGASQAAGQSTSEDQDGQYDLPAEARTVAADQCAS